MKSEAEIKKRLEDIRREMIKEARLQNDLDPIHTTTYLMLRSQMSALRWAIDWVKPTDEVVDDNEI